MKILHVNQQAGRGGAAGICMALHNGLLVGGHESALLVGRKACGLPGVSLIEHDRYRSVWGRLCMAAAKKLNQFSGRIRGAQRVSERWLPRLTSPQRFGSFWSGHEDFDFPGTRHLLDQAPVVPDVLHLHNLHGDYFDLRELRQLSKKIPTMITLHDAWLLAGHCSHSFECTRWKTGCGSCPDLTIPPAIRRDGSAHNWHVKRDIYRHSKVLIVCPSQWLADKVRQSILMNAAIDLKVIPNGVDTTEYKPGDKFAARQYLGWPKDAFIIMFAANGVRGSIWKDFPTMREAIRLIGSMAGGRPIRFFAIGETAPAEQAGKAKIEFHPYREALAPCYQAADVYMHAARADTFPTTILEAMACGTPVVATAVGGITEQISDAETGFLVPAGDATALAERLKNLMKSPALQRALGDAAAQRASVRFSLKRMLSDYIELYQEAMAQRSGYDGQ